MTPANDGKLRRKILALLYATWKIGGKGSFLSPNELVRDAGAEPIAVARNLDLLCDLGLVEDLLSTGACYGRFTTQGGLEVRR